MIKISKGFFFILSLAFLLRITVTIWSSNNIDNLDVSRYKDWGRVTYSYGLADSYIRKHLHKNIIVNNQLPGTLYLITADYYIFRNLLNLNPKIPMDANKLQSLLLKIPAIIADLMLGILIYLIVKSKKLESNSLIGASLYLFNPAVIYNSAIWGQIDALNNLLFFVSLYLLLYKKYSLAIFIFFLSLFIKLSLLPLLPVFIFSIILQTKNFFLPFIMVCISIFSLYLLTLPVSSNAGYFLIHYLFQNSSGEIKSITAFAFNFWWFLVKPFVNIKNPTELLYIPDQTFRVGVITLSIWGYILFFTFLTPPLLKIIPKSGIKISYSNIIWLFTITMLISFLFLPRMHERYFFPVIPLFATYIGFKKKYLITFFLLSIAHFINLYIVWHPINFILLPDMVAGSRFFQWITSAIIVLVSLIFYLRSFKNLKVYAE